MTVRIPEILLPNVEDMSLWAVNACDQFTSDIGYWQKLEKLVGNRRSALHLVFPEIYLKQNPEARIKAINSAMREYLDEGVFSKVVNGFILVERTTESGTRKGIVLSIDLEDYSFGRSAKTPVRSTEETVKERIPARVQIRSGAALELPHAMLLYNDIENVVLNSVVCGDVLYDFDLNMGGGHVKGTFIKNSAEIAAAFPQKGFLFAVGDGNHSLAAAKTCWENLKKNLSAGAAENHPARFALCEAVNIYDSALKFEPIHRFIKTDSPQKFLNGLDLGKGGKAAICINGELSDIEFDSNVPQGIAKLDKYINRFLKTYGGEVDYIHGEEQLKTLSANGAGVILPAIDKAEFFNLIEFGGNLPRKTFSMGEGNEKRYYIEAKKI